jgi:hypothetical protein
MSFLYPATDNLITVTLERDGAAYPIPSGAAVTAAFYSLDGVQLLTDLVAGTSTTNQADWPHGVAAFEFGADQTSGITATNVQLRVFVLVNGQEEEWTVLFELAQPGTESALFPERLTAVASLQAQLAGMGYTVSESDVWSAIKAAEADAQHRLRVFLRPTYVLPFPVPSTDLAAVPDGTPWVEEPGYDYEPDLFQGEGWGYLVTRHKPILSVDYIQFAYPQPLSTVWNLPMEWVRLDKKYGHIRIVPAGTSYSAPFSAWMMQVLGGGRNIPQMIRVRYRAGLENAAMQYPDLVDAVKKMAILRMVETQMPGTSESISADGLSQSKSLDLNQYRDAIKSKLDAVSESIHGIKLMVM